MSNRFHSKYHRSNHHSNPTVGDRDSSHDPIASSEQPFQGEFVLNGQLSAHSPDGYSAIFDDNILVRGTLSSNNLEVNTLSANYGSITEFTSISADIQNLTTDFSYTQYLTADDIKVDILQANDINTERLDSDQAWITELHTISSFTHYHDILISELSGFNVTGDVSIEGDAIVEGTTFTDQLRAQTDVGLDISKSDGTSLIRVGKSGATKTGVAEGINTTASGEASHAEGGFTTASGYASHAEGEFTTASGVASHAEGLNTTASGDYSAATGRRSKAIHNGARVEADSQNVDVSSTALNQYTGRFENGYRFFGGDATFEGTTLSNTLSVSDAYQTRINLEAAHLIDAVVVEGAGTKYVNGIYPKINGVYTYGDITIMLRLDTSPVMQPYAYRYIIGVIGVFYSGIDYYKSNQTGEINILDADWAKATDGSNPAPTVRRATLEDFYVEKKQTTFSLSSSTTDMIYSVSAEPFGSYHFSVFITDESEKARTENITTTVLGISTASIYDSTPSIGDTSDVTLNAFLSSSFLYIEAENVGSDTWTLQTTNLKY